MNHFDFMVDLKELCGKHDVHLTSVELCVEETETYKHSDGPKVLITSGKRNLNIVVTEYILTGQNTCN